MTNPRVPGLGAFAPLLPALCMVLFPGILPGQTLTRFMQVDNPVLPVDTHETLSVATGDLDGDGDEDVVLGRRRFDMLLLNQGGGWFSDASQRLPAVSGQSIAVVLGDVDGDGDLDLVVGTNRGKDRLYFNDGKAKFTDVTRGRLDIDGGATGAMALADLDGDNDLDLLVGGGWSSSNFLAWNDGKGKFTKATQSLPSNSAQFVISDVDKDRDLDVFVLAGGRPYLYTNDGKGRLTDSSSTLLPSSPVSSVLRMDVGDVDRDGDDDAVFGRLGAGIVLYLGDGKGRFQDGTSGRVPQHNDYTGRILLVDLDGDKAPEIVQTNNPQASRGGIDRLFRNNGKGTFTEASASLGFTDVGFRVEGLAPADVDRDGDLDLFLGGDPGTMRLLLNDGKARLTVLNAPFLDRDHDPTSTMAMGDIDGDGDLDFVTGAASRLKVFVNDGRGRFREEGLKRMPPVGFLPTAMLLADVDGDADLDFMISSDRLFINDGKGVFKATTNPLPKSNSVTLAMVAADVDADNDLDLVLAKQRAQNRLYLNDGKGRFTDATSTRMPQDSDYTSSLAVGDVDGDRDLDLVMGNTVYGTLKGYDRLYLNDGKGTFKLAASNLPQNNENTFGIALADLDGDGDLDLTTATGTITGTPGRDRLYFNNGSGVFTDVSRTKLPLMYELTYGLGVADVDGDGDLDLVHANDVDLLTPRSPQNVLLINDGKGGFKNQTKSWLPALGDFTHALLVGDVDGDTDVDIVFGNSNAGATARLASNRLYFNLSQHLVGPGLVRAGATHALLVGAWRDSASTSRAAIPVSSLGSAAIPLPVYGTLGLDLSLSVTWPVQLLRGNPAGAAYQITVPALASLRGLTLYDQALIVDFARPVTTWRLTNPLAHRIY